MDHGVFTATGAPTDVCATPAIFSTAGPTWLVCDASQLVTGVCVYSCCFITVCGEPSCWGGQLLRVDSNIKGHADVVICIMYMPGEAVAELLQWLSWSNSLCVHMWGCAKALPQGCLAQSFPAL